MLAPSCSEETVDDVGVMGECVSERLVVRRGALAKARIVGRDDAIAIRERRDQIAEHVRRSRKAVQQQHNGRIRGPRFAIEDIDPIDLGRAVMNDWDCGLLRSARRGRVGSIGEINDDGVMTLLLSLEVSARQMEDC